MARNGLEFLERFGEEGGYFFGQNYVFEVVAAVVCWNGSRLCYSLSYKEEH